MDHEGARNRWNPGAESLKGAMLFFKCLVFEEQSLVGE